MSAPVRDPDRCGCGVPAKQHPQFHRKLHHGCVYHQHDGCVECAISACAVVEQAEQFLRLN